MKNHLPALFGALALVSPLSAQLIAPGRTLAWSTNTGQGGILRIGLVNGQYFEAEQLNEKNRAAGAVKLVGAILDNGRKVVLINEGQWKEVWEGALFEHEITGTLNAGTARFTFRIVEPEVRVAARHPFVEGQTMRWTSGAGQSGFMRVVFADHGKFILEQRNERNPGAGLNRFEGEVRDGKIIMFNKQWHETWVGVFVNGKVVGKINDRTEFTIFE
jgi:hypothetical protein